MRSNQGRKARVIAKIKGFTDLEPESVKEASKNWISVHRPNGNDSETVTVSFGGDESTSHKESYDLDYCYYRSEENDLIFTREVKPLVEDVFNDFNATVIAYGARGSGKTHTIQGIGEKRATYILELREESPEHFKDLDCLKDIGLSEKEIKGIVSKEIGGLFN